MPIDHQTFSEMTPSPLVQRRGVTIGGVYFIRGGDKIKIGRSGFVRQRFSDIQQLSPIRLQAVGFIRCDDTASAVELEKQLHDRFKKIWSHGEWFHETADLTAFMARRLSAWPPPIHQ
jgi:hypothetical protein